MTTFAIPFSSTSRALTLWWMVRRDFSSQISERAETFLWLSFQSSSYCTKGRTTLTLFSFRQRKRRRFEGTWWKVWLTLVLEFCLRPIAGWFRLFWNWIRKENWFNQFQVVWAPVSWSRDKQRGFCIETRLKVVKERSEARERWLENWSGVVRKLRHRHTSLPV